MISGQTIPSVGPLADSGKPQIPNAEALETEAIGEFGESVERAATTAGQLIYHQREEQAQVRRELDIAERDLQVAAGHAKYEDWYNMTYQSGEDQNRLKPDTDLARFEKGDAGVRESILGDTTNEGAKNRLSATLQTMSSGYRRRALSLADRYRGENNDRVWDALYDRATKLPADVVTEIDYQDQREKLVTLVATGMKTQVSKVFAPEMADNVLEHGLYQLEKQWVWKQAVDKAGREDFDSAIEFVKQSNLDVRDKESHVTGLKFLEGKSTQDTIAKIRKANTDMLKLFDAGQLTPDKIDAAEEDLGTVFSDRWRGYIGNIAANPTGPKKSSYGAVVELQESIANQYAGTVSPTKNVDSILDARFRDNSLSQTDYLALRKLAEKGDHPGFVGLSLEQAFAANRTAFTRGPWGWFHDSKSNARANAAIVEWLNAEILARNGKMPDVEDILVQAEKIRGVSAEVTRPPERKAPALAPAGKSYRLKPNTPEEVKTKVTSALSQGLEWSDILQADDVRDYIEESNADAR